MRIWSWTLIILLLAGCTSEESATPTDNSAVMEEARAALLAYGDAISAGDIATAATYYDDDPDFHWIERGGIQYEDGRSAAESLSALVVRGASATMAFETIRIADLGPNSALVSAHFDFAMSYDNGEPGFGFDGWMTVAMVKRVDGWRFAGGQVGPGRE